MGLVFKITDNKGKKSVVKDNSQKKSEAVKRFKTTTDAKSEDEGQFTKDEVKALKTLVSKLDDLLALITPEDKKDKKDKEDKKEDKDDKSFDEEFEFDEDEEVVATKDEDVIELPDGEDEQESDSEKEITEDGLVDVDEELDDVKSTKTNDSKKSFGAIEQNQKKNEVYSNEAIQGEINEAFRKYYGGRK